MFGKNKKKNESEKEHKPCLSCTLQLAAADERASLAEDRVFQAEKDFEDYKKRQGRIVPRPYLF